MNKQRIARATQFHIFESRFIFESILREFDIREKQLRRALKKCIRWAGEGDQRRYEEGNCVELRYLCHCLGMKLSRTRNHKKDAHKAYHILQQFFTQTENNSNSNHNRNPSSTMIVPFRGLLLALYLSVCRDNDRICDYAFTIYDRDGSGCIEMGELCEILFATTPIITSNEDVQRVVRKAKFIMRQCGEDGSGQLTRREFRAMAKKYPHLVLPQRKWK